MAAVAAGGNGWERGPGLQWGVEALRVGEGEDDLDSKQGGSRGYGARGAWGVGTAERKWGARMEGGGGKKRRLGVEDGVREGRGRRGREVGAENGQKRAVDESGRVAGMRKDVSRRHLKDCEGAGAARGIGGDAAEGGVGGSAAAGASEPRRLKRKAHIIPGMEGDVKFEELAGEMEGGRKRRIGEQRGGKEEAAEGGAAATGASDNRVVRARKPTNRFASGKMEGQMYVCVDDAQNRADATGNAHVAGGFGGKGSRRSGQGAVDEDQIWREKYDLLVWLRCERGWREGCEVGRRERRERERERERDSQSVSQTHTHTHTHRERERERERERDGPGCVHVYVYMNVYTHIHTHIHAHIHT